MPKLTSILEFLRDRMAESRVIGVGEPDNSFVVHGVEMDRSATTGQMAWMSQRVLESEPHRLEGFGGSLLLCPDGADPTPKSGTWYLTCATPKLAIIEVIKAFFPELTGDELPAYGEPSIHPKARLGEGVRVAAGAVLGAGVTVGNDVSVGPNTVVTRCEIGDGTVIGANCTIGLAGFGMEKHPSGRYVRFPHVGRVRIGAEVEIGSNVCIDRGSIGDTVIGDGARIDNLVHVAHNVVIEDDALVIANSMLGGSVTVGRGAWIAPSAPIMNQVTIGYGAVVRLGAVVLGDVEADTVVAGSPARELKKKGG